MAWTKPSYNLPPQPKPVDWAALEAAQRVIREQVCDWRGHLIDPNPSQGTIGRQHWHCARCGIEFVPKERV